MWTRTCSYTCTNNNKHKDVQNVQNFLQMQMRVDMHAHARISKAHAHHMHSVNSATTHTCTPIHTCAHAPPLDVCTCITHDHTHMHNIKQAPTCFSKSGAHQVHVRSQRKHSHMHMYKRMQTRVSARCVRAQKPFHEHMCVCRHAHACFSKTYAHARHARNQRNHLHMRMQASRRTQTRTSTECLRMHQHECPDVRVHVGPCVF